MSNEPELVQQIKKFVIAGHGDLDQVKAMLAAQPDLLNQAYTWAPGDVETAIQAAAHMGQPAIAEYLLARGAPLDICTAAMLGRVEDVNRLLSQDPARIHAVGAHEIPLLTHAAWSDNVALVQQLWTQGARTGTAEALCNLIPEGRKEMPRWLIAYGEPDLGWKDFQGKTVLQVARAQGDEELIRLLEEYQNQSAAVG